MKKVLVVDDSSTILALLKSELSKHENIQAFYAKTYKDAMRLIRENQGNFHAALLDLNLPDAQNGEIVRLANSHHIPAVVLSASMDQELKESILKKDVVDFVLKADPASIEFAVNAIHRTLKNYDTTILIVDDSATYRQAISDSLKRIHLNIVEAKDGQEALDILDTNKNISLIITDYEMPKLNGLELVHKVRQKYKKDELSIIAVSSVDKKEIITKFLRYGANDFLNKPFSSDEIITRINSNLELLDLFTQVKEMANRDFLTGLYNRRYFFSTAKPIFLKTKRKESKIVLAMIDIDMFKNINDNYGHDVGDICIKEVKNILNSNLRESDLIARFGGEEFCILLEDISLEDTETLFNKIRKSFESNSIKIDNTTIQYTVSIGVKYGLSNSLEEMIKLSDEALYEAKESGRNRVVVKT